MNVSKALYYSLPGGLRWRPAPGRNWETTQAVGAFLGLAGGMAAPLLGLFLLAAGWLAGAENTQQALSQWGSFLLYLTMPLIALAACCLDGLEKAQARRRAKEQDFYD